VQLDGIEQPHLVTALSKGDGIPAGTTADVVDGPGRRRQMPHEQVERADVLEPSGRVEPPVLVAVGVVAARVVVHAGGVLPAPDALTAAQAVAPVRDHRVAARATVDALRHAVGRVDAVAARPTDVDVPAGPARQ
jgi:hypothetical protein